MIGPFKLLEQIGEGGFGLVFMAEQLQPVRRKVAVKILKPGMDSRQVIARFEVERQVLAMMEHAHIARVLDAGETASGRPYFAMELVRRIIREEEPARPSTRLSTMGEEATVVSARRQSDPQRLRRLFRGELDWIVMKALEKDRGRRYDTASAFAADVQRYVHDQPVEACPPSASYRFGKFARHHRGALAFGAVITAALVLLVGSIGWMARDQAEREAALVRDQAAKEAALERRQAARDARLAGEQAAREAALDTEVTRALDDDAALIAASKWQAALAPVQRAHKLLVAAGRAQLPLRFLESQRDQAMLERLASILGAAKGKKTQHVTPEEVVWVNNEFTRAFRDFGIDVPALAAPEAARRIQTRAPRQELAWALDYWSTKRKFAVSAEAILWAKASGLEMGEALQLYRRTNKEWMKIDWKHLLEVAREADSDPWRNRLRDAVIKEDDPALKALAATAPIRDLRPNALFLLGNALVEANDRESAFVLLHKAQREYPADLTLNETLAWLYNQTSRPAHYDEAIRYYWAALAVRPHSAYLHHRLGTLLLMKGRKADALEEFSMAIELDPTQILAWQPRGQWFLAMGLRGGHCRFLRCDPTGPERGALVSTRPGLRNDAAMGECPCRFHASS